MYTVTDILLFITLILSICYAALLESWTAAWGKVIERIGGKEQPEAISMTVVVPFRNEEKHLASCIAALKSQKAVDGQVEFILVNDDSGDSSVALVTDLIHSDARFRLVYSAGTGKKEAIRTAVEMAQHPYIATLDADCSVGENWANTILRELKFTQADFLILPVLVHSPDSFIGKIAFTEWMSLVSITGGAALSKNALMCNGANLAFRKRLYSLYTLPNEHSVSSGDDMFLMIEAKKVGVVSYCANSHAIARTSLPEGIGEFLSQRIRWAGKSKLFTDKYILIVGALILVLQFLYLLLLILWILGSIDFVYFSLLLVIKLLFEYRLLSGMSRVFNVSWSLTSFIVMSLAHPFYSIFVAVLSIGYKPIWKGRKIHV